MACINVFILHAAILFQFQGPPTVSQELPILIPNHRARSFTEHGLNTNTSINNNLFPR